MAKLSLSTFILFVCLGASQVFAADEWWEHGHYYQIYPRSFQDSDGDGIGDLNGITSRMEYFKEIGVTGVWLSPIFKSPMLDFGYDISDYRSIQPEFGTLDDFKRFIKRAKELDIKVVLDFVANHCSDQHEWFQKATNPKHEEHEKYRDYFIWNEGKLAENGTRVPPSNWLSVFRGSAWKWHEEMQAFYLHQFLVEQPDLNFRNPAVREEMNEILRYWLRLGVDGFRVDAVPYIYEAKENADGFYDDEPKNTACPPADHCSLDHIYTKDQPETFEIFYSWHKVFEEEEFANRKLIMMEEAYTSLENYMKLYGKTKNGRVTEIGAEIPFNFILMGMNKDSKVQEFEKLINEFMDNLPEGDKIEANWLLGNHDRPRIASNFGPAQTDLWNIFILTMKGISVTYYGEEIGMTDVFISWEDTVDPQACQTSPEEYQKYTRDKVRTPMQWDGSFNAGFGKAKKNWLPLADNYTECNVELQRSQKYSFFKNYVQLTKLRQNPTMKYGDFELKTAEDTLLVYKRQMKKENTKTAPRTDSDTFVVVLNKGSAEKTVDLNDLFKDSLPRKMEVVVSSIHAKTLRAGTVVKTNKVVIPANVGVVLADYAQFSLPKSHYH